MIVPTPHDVAVAREIAPEGFLAPFAACPWCNGRALESFVERAPFHLDRCQACGVAFVNPPPGPELLAEQYPEGYYPTEKSAVRQHLRWKRYDFRRVLPRVKRLIPGRWLDVGCGIGGILVAARKAGFHVQGVEIGKEAAEFGAREFGVEIHVGTIDDAPLEEGSFTVISLFHVLEHLRDPTAEIERLTRLLKPGGALIIECPALDSLSARLFGDGWFHLEVPRHLFHFPAAALSRRLQNHGLAVEMLSGHHAAHSAASFHGSLYPPKAGLPLWRKVIRRGGYLVTRALSPILAACESATGKGSTVRMIGRKPL